MSEIIFYTAADGSQYLITFSGIIFLLAILLTNLTCLDLLKKTKKYRKILISLQILISLILFVLLLMFGVVLRMTTGY